MCEYINPDFLHRMVKLMTNVPSNEKERLSRLIESGRCKAVEAPAYVSELKRLAHEVAEVEASSAQSKFFKTLADETRLRMLSLLAMREMCVCELMVALSLTQPTASHHLKLLENAGLTKRRKEGKWVFYSIADRKLMEKVRRLASFKG
jgi:ArsR family transcriptional regulator